ncbi:MAG: hypothetical protein PHV36_11745 [Elusimicrobiales bacterium]|nr:hypothetical protein [Elusimicrobiales bacterium]
MSVNVTCACGAVYNLKDEYAGSQLACPKCGAAIAVPALPPAPPVHVQGGDAVFSRDKFLLNQQHLAIREKYDVADEAGAPLMFVERPRYIFLNVLAIFAGLFAGLVNLFFFGAVGAGIKKGGGDPMLVLLLSLWAVYGSFLVVYLVAAVLAKKRHITIYRDESKAETLLQVLQESKIQILTASFSVLDPQGVRVARIFKKRLHNILRKRWYCHDGAGAALFIAKEDSMILSMLRFFLGSFFGLLRTNYMIYDRGENILGEFNRKLTILDRYVLDMSADSRRSIDRRAALAMGVLLDTGEKR